MSPNPIQDARQLAKVLTPGVIKRFLEAVSPGPAMALGAVGTLPWMVGRGPSLGILSQMNAIAHGTTPAVVDRNGTLTWREIDQRANRLAHALEEMGLEPGRSMATLLRNGREFVETVFAAQKLGVEIAPLNTWAKPKELKTTLGRAKPLLLIHDAKHADQVKEAVSKDIGLVTVGGPKKQRSRDTDYERLLENQSDEPPPPLATDRGKPRIIIHTSGTSGKPKAAARGTGARQIASFLGLIGVVPFERGDVIACPAPLFHSFGLLSLTIGTVLGGTLVLPEKFDPEGTLDLLEEHEATAATLVPVMIRRILALPESAKRDRDFSALRILLASGSQMSPDFRTDTLDYFGDVLYDLYGSTEAGWVAIATPEDMRDDPRTLGKPVPGVEVAVFSEDGERQGPGDKGILHVKSSVVFEGYTSGEETPEREGYIEIGDTGWLDEDGRLFVEGRGDDMVVVGGENVYPQEIEEVIEGIDGVEEVAVVGVEDEELGSVLAAFIKGKADPEKIKETCKRELASFKVPKFVETVDDFPRTSSTGKIQKKELAEKFQESEKSEKRSA
jgi:fatty-acyl-CoA synthase